MKITLFYRRQTTLFHVASYDTTDWLWIVKMMLMVCYGEVGPVSKLALRIEHE